MTNNTRAPISNEMYKIGEWLLRKEFCIVKKEYNFMDLFAYHQSTGDSCEIEIKCNDYDFYKEFTKPCKRAKHKAYKYHARKPLGFCPTRFYFLVPHILGARALKRIKAEYPHYGLIVWNTYEKQERIIRKAKRMHEKPYNNEFLEKPFARYLKHYRKMEAELHRFNNPIGVNHE